MTEETLAKYLCWKSQERKRKDKLFEHDGK